MKKIPKNIIIAAIVIGVLALLWFLSRPQNAQAVTDKTEYGKGESLTIFIKNSQGKKICFSSCYPYYLQTRQNRGEWQDYDYAVCQTSNIAVSCINSGSSSAFELKLVEGLGLGESRLAVPVCTDCDLGAEFKQTAVIYSNIFQVR